MITAPGQRGALAAVGLMMLLAPGLEAVTAWTIASGDFQRAAAQFPGGYAALVLTVLAGFAVLRGLEILVVAHRMTIAESDLSRRFLRDVLRMPISLLEAVPVRTHIDQIDALVGLAGLLHLHAVRAIADLVLLLVLVALLFQLDLRVGLAMVALLLIVGAGTLTMATPLRRALIASRITARRDESLTTQKRGRQARLIAAGIAPGVERKHRRLRDARVHADWHRAHRLRRLRFLSYGLIAAALMSALALLVSPLREAPVDLARALAVLWLTGLAARRAAAAIQTLPHWLDIAALNGQYRNLQRLPLEPVDAGSTPLPAGQATSLTLETLNYVPPGQDAAILDEVSLRLEPGRIEQVETASPLEQLILMRLCSGLLTPTGGRVCLDGVLVGAAALRHLVAVARAPADLFDASLLRNLQLAGPAGTAEDRADCAARTGLAEDLAALRQGWETPAGGTTARPLSPQGEFRLELTRALLLKRPYLVVCPPPGLDATESDALMRLLRKLSVEKGILLISADPRWRSLQDRPAHPRASGELHF